MIKYLMLDIDETLIHTALSDPKQKHIRFALEDGGVYYTMVRPCAKRLIDFSRELVGAENVYILTAATKEYACEINRLAEWGFPENQILAREDLSNHYYSTAYGGGATVASKYASLDNVLIDDLDPRYNSDKISFLGIWRSLDTNYLQVQPYYGTNFPNDPFEENAIKFLEGRLKAASLCKEMGEEKMEVQAGE
jgi:hypothetical protein